MDDTKKKLEKIEAVLEKIDGRLDSIDVTLVKQEAQLELHIYRTTLAEQNLAQIREEMKPVKKHVQMVNNVFKTLGVIGTIIGFFGGLIKLFFEIK